MRNRVLRAKVRFEFDYLGLNTMLYNFRFLILLSAIFIGTAYSSHDALAQGESTTEVIEIKHNSNSLFPRHFYTIEFFNNPNESESRFTMRLASYGEVSGCAKMSKSKVKKNESHEQIALELRDSEIRVNKRQPRYTNYDCKIKTLQSYVDVKMSRNSLIKKNIKKIKLTSKRYGDFSDSELKITKEKLELTTKSPSGSHMVTFWFLPRNTVVLHAPNAKQGEDIKDSLRKFGEDQGLVSIEDKYDGYELPYTAKHYVMFTDPEGNIADKIKNVDENINVGSIALTRTVFGPKGAVDEPYTIPVMATIPGRSKP